MPATTDLWPDFKAPEKIDSPVFVLKEQAATLQQKTKGLVLARLKSASTPNRDFWLGFDLYSPGLGEYSYRLFEVTYPPQLFPITLSSADGAQTAHNLDEFKTVLKSALGSPRTQQVVEAIMAQATAIGDEDENWYTPGVLRD
jgi:hypothetical protein